MTTIRVDSSRLDVTLTAGTGTFQSIRFGTPTRSIDNAAVQITTSNGPVAITVPTTVPLPAHPTQITFRVVRQSVGPPVTVPIVVVDGCGQWQTLAGFAN